MDPRSCPLAFVQSVLREDYLEMNPEDAWGKKKNLVRLCQSPGWKLQRRPLGNAAVPIQENLPDYTDFCLPHKSLKSPR